MQNLANLANMSKLWGKGGLAPSESFVLQATSGTISPADGQVTYIWQGSQNTLTAADSRIYVFKKCILKKMFIYARTSVAPTSELSTLEIIVNGTTSYTVTNSYDMSTQTLRNYSNQNLNIPLNPGDYFCLKRTVPTWVTNPTNVVLNAFFGLDWVPSVVTWEYVLQVGTNSFSPADWLTYYITDSEQTNTATEWRMYAPFSWTLVAVYIYARCTVPWSNEAITFTLRKNITTDYDITTTATLDATHNVYQNVSMSVPLNAWDYFSLKMICPTWVTNPTGITMRFTAVIQRT